MAAPARPELATPRGGNTGYRSGRRLCLPLERKAGASEGHGPKAMNLRSARRICEMIAGVLWTDPMLSHPGQMSTPSFEITKDWA